MKHPREQLLDQFLDCNRFQSSGLNVVTQSDETEWYVSGANKQLQLKNVGDTRVILVNYMKALQPHVWRVLDGCL